MIGVRAALEYLSGPQEGERVVLRDDITILGKSAECDVRIASTYVSRQHCQISRTGQNWMLHDLRSRNGTFLNGKRVPGEAMLKANDTLGVGQTSFRVLFGADAEGPAEARAKTDYRSVVPALVDLLESDEPLVAGAAGRIGQVAGLLAKQLGLGPYEQEALSTAAWLANISMQAIPREILYCRTPLTAEQWAVVRLHPEQAVGRLSGCTLDPAVVAGVRSHHERPDGGGYPDGLAGGAIPWVAQLLAPAEAIVAMAADRPYRAALGPDAVRTEIKEGAGSQFDQRAADAASRVLKSEADTVRRLLGGA